MNLKARLGNKALWVSLFSLVVLTGKIIPALTIPYVTELLTSTEWVALLLLVLTLLGLVNDPTTKDPWFADDKVDKE